MQKQSQNNYQKISYASNDDHINNIKKRIMLKSNGLPTQ